MKDHGTNGVSAINKRGDLYVISVHGEREGSAPSRNEAEENLTDYLRHHLRHQHQWKGDDLRYMRMLSLTKLRRAHEVDHQDVGEMG